MESFEIFIYLEALKKELGPVELEIEKLKENHLNDIEGCVVYPG